MDATPRRQGFDPQSIKPFLVLKEEGLFRVWLGLDFYDTLLADLTDVSGAVNFVEGTNYALGTIVKWRERYYKSIAATTGELPTDGAKWDKSIKFETETHNYFWERYLRTVLSWAVMHTSLVYNAIQQTALGVVQHSEDNARSVRVRDLASFKHEVGIDLNDFLQTMDAYLRRNKGDFENYMPNQLGANDNTTDDEAGVVGHRDPNYGFTCFDE